MVDVSVGGGRDVPVIVDTGSAGLLIPISDIGFQHLGFPTGIGLARFGGLEEVVYLKVPTTIDFGNGIATGPTTVDAVLFSFPRSLEDGLEPAVGIMGVGPDALGPASSPVTTALPGDLSQGVLIDQPQGLLQFGPNPLPAGPSVEGAPITDLGVQINGGAIQPEIAAIDSGGVTGVLPSSVAGNVNSAGGLLGGFGTVQPGTHISVYADDGKELLYSYVTTPEADPAIVPNILLPLLDGFTNTGNTPFTLDPIYISNSPSGVGQITFDILPAGSSTGSS